MSDQKDRTEHKGDGLEVRMGDWGPWLGIDPETQRRTVTVEPVWYPAGDYERAVMFRPGYRTDRKTYGRHGMEITWLLRGPRGVTQFVIFTQWEPGMTDRERGLDGPMGADVGYHASAPQYEGQGDARDDCTYLPGGSCHYDGSGLAAGELVREFLIHGEQIVWQRLAERHDELRVDGEPLV